MAVKQTPQRRVLAVAASQVGYTRWKDSKRGTRYARDTQPVFWPRDYWLLANGINYCDIFVTWVFWKALGKEFVDKHLPGGASYNTDYRASKGGRVSKSEAAPGDILVFDWNWNTRSTNHVGILEKRLSGNRFQTLEGNTSPGASGSQDAGGGVWRRIRKHSQVRYVLRPNWKAAGGSEESVAAKKSPWNSSRTIDRLSKAEVKEIQRRLKDLGYSLGHYGVDGSYGKSTYNAVRAFQKAAGLAVDGVAGPDTQKALKSAQKGKGSAKSKAPAFPLPKGYYYGDAKGPVQSVSGKTKNSRAPKDVVQDKHGKWYSKGLKQAQAKLGITADGRFGDQTAKAVVKFKKGVKNVGNTPRLGEETWKALFKS